MHELAIAQSLIESATSALPANVDVQVKSLRVQLGALAGLSKEELQFGFSVVATGTPFAGARLEIEDVPVVVHCSACQTESTLSDPDLLLCPLCASRWRSGIPLATVNVVQGKDLTLQSIEVSDSMPFHDLATGVNGQ